ncbi:MAG: bactofilin family protein [Caulobacteraceae bacterium]
MFSKSKPTNSPAPKASNVPPPLDPAILNGGAARKPASKSASVIGNDITIEGGVTGDGELHVDGVVRGDIRVGRLTVGETGQVDGSVYGEMVEVRGKVVGSITAKQIRLYGTAHVDGDITHEQLAMETGAFFQGRSLKFQRPAQGQPQAQPAPYRPAEAPASHGGDVINLGLAGGN